MLYLIATPIGHLQDLSLRAIETLRSCDYVLCEDTRVSLILFRAHHIATPLKSFHLFNEKKQEDQIIQHLKDGKQIGLISDAGTPGISDPGEALIQRLYLENLPLTAVPGPSAWVVALSLSPFPKSPAQFLGFSPKKSEERKKWLASFLLYPGTSIFYESPSRLVSTLQQIPDTREICVMRELTKIHEEHRIGSPLTLVSHYSQNPPKGECVVLVAPSTPDYTTLSLQDHVHYVAQTFNLSLPDAIKAVSNLRSIPKREVYHAIHL